MSPKEENKNGGFRLIGITGEAGAGKSVVLSYLAENYPCEVLVADHIGNEVKMPGKSCYQPVIDLLGADIILPDGQLNKAMIAEKIFANPDLVEAINDIIHPAVREEIFRRVEEVRAKGEKSFVFIEAALLIEAGYVDDLDELWYICSEPSVRRLRLKETRGYLDERIDGIARNQLSKDGFLQYADRVIINDFSLEELYQKIDDIMGEYQWEK